MPGQDNAVMGAAAMGAADREPYPDEHMRDQMSYSLNEASERVTFHRIELERWERLGRAAAEALRELDRCTPVAKQSPEDFGSDQVAAPEQRFAA